MTAEVPEPAGETTGITDILGSEQGGTDEFGPESGGTDEFGPESGGTDEFGPESGGTDEFGPETGGTDVVMANILAETLIGLHRQLQSLLREGGQCLLSAIDSARHSVESEMDDVLADNVSDVAAGTPRRRVLRFHHFFR